jgi:hypothetical protein
VTLIDPTLEQLGYISYLYTLTAQLRILQSLNCACGLDRGVVCADVWRQRVAQY